MKANAVVFTQPNTVSFQEIDCPEPSHDQVVVQVTRSWISNGTEGSYLRGERIEGDTPWRPGNPQPFPIVAGYQKVGRIIWVGSEVRHLRCGDLVFATVSLVQGMFEPRGGHVSPAVCNSGAVFKLPDGADPIAFAGVTLAQVGYNCGMRPSLQAGDAAIVLGDGLVGQWAAQTLAWRGAQVALVGKHEDRLAHFGGGATILVDGNSWPERVRQLFPEGVEIAVDTVGSIQAVEHLQDLLKHFGHLVSAGFYGQEDRLPLQPPRYRELSIHLVSGATRERLEKTLELVHAGILDTKSLITHRFPAKRAADAWNLIQAKREPFLGVVLEW